MAKSFDGQVFLMAKSFLIAKSYMSQVLTDGYALLTG
jgi:hypothetical protein